MGAGLQSREYVQEEVWRDLWMWQEKQRYCDRVKEAKVEEDVEVEEKDKRVEGRARKETEAGCEAVEWEREERETREEREEREGRKENIFASRKLKFSP